MARILIIDDEPQIRSMLRLMLERDGYEVVEAPDGIEGIRAYRQKPTDLIITDLIMPNKDGIGMIIELKKEFPDKRVAAFVNALKLFGLGFSWGGYKSLLTVGKYLRTAGSDYSERTIFRVNVGLEDARDLIVDLQNGLKHLQISEDSADA